jgi:hypothetical protein
MECAGQTGARNSRKLIIAREATKKHKEHHKESHKEAQKAQKIISFIICPNALCFYTVSACAFCASLWQNRVAVDDCR